MCHNIQQSTHHCSRIVVQQWILTNSYLLFQYDFVVYVTVILIISFRKATNNFQTIVSLLLLSAVKVEVLLKNKQEQHSGCFFSGSLGEGQAYFVNNHFGQNLYICLIELWIGGAKSVLMTISIQVKVPISNGTKFVELQEISDWGYMQKGVARGRPSPSNQMLPRTAKTNNEQVSDF